MPAVFLWHVAMSLYVLCFVSDIYFPIFHGCRWNDRLRAVGIVHRGKVSGLLAVGEPRAKQQRVWSHCHRHSSFLFIHSSLEYSCANISICLVRLHVIVSNACGY